VKAAMESMTTRGGLALHADTFQLPFLQLLW